MSEFQVPGASGLGLSPDEEVAEERRLLEESLHEIQNRRDYWSSSGLQRQAADCWSKLYPGQQNMTNRGPRR